MKQSVISTLPDVKRLDRLQRAFARCNPPITKKELAEKAPYSYEYVIRIFSGKRPVSDEAIEKFAPILHVRREFLHGIDNFMTEDEYKSTMEYANAYTSLIGRALISSNYSFLDPETDLSQFEDYMDYFSFDILKGFLDEGNHAIMINENDMDDRYREYEFSVLDSDTFIALVRDIQNYIKVKVQQAFEDNYIKTLFKISGALPIIE